MTTLRRRRTAATRGPSTTPRSDGLHARAIRHPRGTITAGVVLTLVVGSGVAKLELATDGRALVPHGAPEVLYDREVRRTFDVEDQVAVVVETADPAGIFNLGTLRLVDELTRELAALPGVDPAEVTSLATEHSRWSGGRNALDFKTFLDPFPESDDDLAEIRGDLAGMGIYTGTLVSRDGDGPPQTWSPSATAIMVGLERDADRSLVHRRILAAVDAKGELEEKIHVVGAPIAESLLGRHILEDLATLVPIAILLMSLVFWLRYRSATSVLLPMTEVAAALVFTFGLMGHLGVPISLPITVMPVILTALGVADEIHVFDRYARLLSRRTEAGAASTCLRQTLDEMWRPVVKTSVTTSVGFLSFALSPIAPVRHFGTFTAVGVLFCMVWTLTVIPAALTLRRTVFPAVAARGDTRFVRWGDAVLRRRGTVLAVAVLLAAAVPFGLGRLTVQDSWIDGFAETSPFRQSTETVNRLFHGTHLLLVHLDTRAGAIRGELRALPEAVQVPERLAGRLEAEPDLDPAALVGERTLLGAVPSELAGRPAFRERRADLTAEVSAAVRGTDHFRVELVPELGSSARRFLTSRPGRRWTFFTPGERMLDPRMLERVRDTGAFIEERLAGIGGGVLDLYDQVSVARYIVYGRREEERRIGPSPLRNRYLLNVLGNVRGSRRLEEVVDGSRQQTLVTVFVKDANFLDVGRLMNEVREYARVHLSPLGVRVGFAGDVAVSQAMIGAIVSTQTRSLLLSLVGIFLVAALLGRSLWLGWLCLLPPALAVLLDFSLMGAAGIPLGVATSMFAAMTIGIGVDFAIHLTERFRFPAAAEPGARARLGEALSVTGPAILMNTLAVALGFGVMTLSSVPANGRLGLLVVASVVVCFLSTLVVLPLLLTPGARSAARSPAGRWPDC